MRPYNANLRFNILTIFFFINPFFMKTKSYLFAAASATLMLASCTQNEVVEMPATRAIGFGTYVGNTSRAEAVDTDLDFLKNTGNGFYVFGSYMDEGKGEVIVFDGLNDGSHVISKGTESDPAWGYNPLNYWSDGKAYKFAAYGPAAVKAETYGTKSFSYNDNTISISGFQADGKTDLVVAEGDGVYSWTKNDANTPTVNFKFFHALSKVRFTIKNGWRNDVILTVNGVHLQNVKSNGNLVTNGSMAATGTNAWNTITWSEIGTPMEYDNWKTEANFVSTKYTETHFYDYFLIPQTLTESGIKLVLTCRVNNSNGDGYGPDLGNGAGQPKEISVTLPSNTIAAWEPGKAYNYTLTVDGDIFGLKPIQFDAVDVVTWENVNKDLGKEDLTPKP